MDYTILRVNDNATATVEMVINGNTLVQDFPLGKSQDALVASIMTGLAVFQAELDNAPTPTYTPDNIGIDVSFTANDLPVIEPPTKLRN